MPVTEPADDERAWSDWPAKRSDGSWPPPSPPSTASSPSSTGRPGADNTKPKPAQATTPARPLRRN